MATKDAASKDARDHIERARSALESAHRDGLSAADVLRNPHVSALEDSPRGDQQGPRHHRADAVAVLSSCSRALVEA
jgi:hypothetical protein